MRSTGLWFVIIVIPLICPDLCWQTTAWVSSHNLTTNSELMSSMMTGGSTWVVKDKRHIDRSICSSRYLINVTITTGQTYFHSNNLEIVQLRLRQKHEDGELTIKQSCDLNYVGRGAELLVRISILANIYRTSQSGHTTHSSLISTIARLCRRSVLTLAVFSRRFISIFIWWDLIVHIPDGGLLLLSHVDTLAPPTPQSG